MAEANAFAHKKHNKMINVTLGEVKTQEEKPFPKLMISEVGQIFYMVEVNPNRSDLLVGFQLHSNGFSIGGNGFSKRMSRSSFTDYNEPITIQNA